MPWSATGMARPIVPPVRWWQAIGEPDPGRIRCVGRMACSPMSGGGCVMQAASRIRRKMGLKRSMMFQSSLAGRSGPLVFGEDVDAKIDPAWLVWFGGGSGVGQFLRQSVDVQQYAHRGRAGVFP